MDIKKRETQRNRRKRRVRTRIQGTKEKPRISVYRSNKHIYAQIINDVTGNTLVSMSDTLLDEETYGDKTKTEIAHAVGKELGVKAKKVGVKKAVFDKGAYQYHGRVMALAEGVREAGIQM